MVWCPLRCLSPVPFRSISTLSCFLHLPLSYRRDAAPPWRDEKLWQWWWSGGVNGLLSPVRQARRPFHRKDACRVQASVMDWAAARTGIHADGFRSPPLSLQLKSKATPFFFGSLSLPSLFCPSSTLNGRGRQNQPNRTKQIEPHSFPSISSTREAAVGRSQLTNASPQRRAKRAGARRP